MKKNLLIGAGVVALIVAAFLMFRGPSAAEGADLMAKVIEGPFRVEIETTGELEAKNSVKIQGPAQLRNFGIWNIAIQKIIDEGTTVKKGDWIADLDRSEFQTKFSAKQIEVEKENAEYIQTQLDTTLQLREARDNLINLKYAVEEKRIVLEQSKYEPPATIKQAQIDQEKAARAYQQAVQNYTIKQRQNSEKMREQAAELRKVQDEFNNMTSVMQNFTVTAPEAGMVIYHKGWDGKPIKAGSQVNLWEPTVATLPDLSKMMSRTYVNEVDVRKVSTGQLVDIGLDAYPDKRLRGKVTHVASVGEQRPNSDAKVFEVSVEIDGYDEALRPSMTTSNKIVAKMIGKAMFIPLECLHNQADTVTYVYKKEGLNTIKQEVMIGETNANNVVILGGIGITDRLYLSVPAGMEEDNITLLREMNGKRKKKQDEATPASAPVVAANATSSN